MNIISLLAQDSFLMVNINLIRHIGLDEAVIIGELARKYNYWMLNDRLTEGEYFFITYEDINKDTGLTINSIKAAIKHLVELNVIQVQKLGGTNRSNYYRINEEILINFIN